MKELDVQEVINMNYRLSTLLGIATSIIRDYQKLEAYHDSCNICDWWMTAIQAVVYQNKPIPPFSDKNSKIF